MNLELTYHQDPGHGWIFADNATLASLGLNSGSFSRYSYKDEKGLYEVSSPLLTLPTSSSLTTHAAARA